MTVPQLLRWSNTSLIAGGVSLALFTLSHPASESRPTDATLTQWMLAHSFHWLGAFLLLFGLIGLYTQVRSASGRFGFVAFAVAFVGTATFFAGGVVSAFVDPVLPITSLIASGATPARLAPYVGFIAVGSSGFILGWILVGATLLRTRAVPTAAAIATIAAPLLFFIPPPGAGPVVIQVTHGVWFGGALVWMALTLRRATAPVGAVASSVAA